MKEIYDSEKGFFVLESFGQRIEIGIKRHFETKLMKMIFFSPEPFYEILTYGGSPMI